MMAPLLVSAGLCRLATQWIATMEGKRIQFGLKRTSKKCLSMNLTIKAASLSCLDNLQPNSGFHRCSHTIALLRRYFSMESKKKSQDLFLDLIVCLVFLFFHLVSLTQPSRCSPPNELGSPSARYWYKFHWIKLEMKAKRVEKKKNTRNRSYSCAVRESLRSLGKYSIKIVEKETKISSHISPSLEVWLHCR